MKKITLGVMLLLVTVYLASCSIQKDVGDNPRIGESPIEKIENSKHLISVEAAEKLYDNFRTRFRGPIREIQESECIVERKDYEPTRYVLMNIELLENYIKLLKAVEKKNDNKKITGIAVFFWANNMNEEFSKKPPFNKAHGEEMALENESGKHENIRGVVKKDIRGRVTIFIAPTYRLNDKELSLNDEDTISEIQRHVPFYIQRKSGETDPYKGIYTNLLNILDPEEISAGAGIGIGPMTNLKANFNKTTLPNDDETTSLVLEELTDMPPKEPIITGQNKI